MRNLAKTLSIAIVMAMTQVACQDSQAGVPHVLPPELGRDTPRREVEVPKPLPAEEPAPVAAQPFDDEPLLVDPIPEAKAFIETYNKVNRPRILVFVNRTIETPPAPSPQGAPADYDELGGKSIDHALIEMKLADWISSNGRVSIVSPAAIRRQLTPEQLKAMESGAQGSLDSLVNIADVIVHVEAYPVRQAGRGMEIRLLAEASNIRGGESLARAAVDMYTPLEKTTLNRFTRFVARKLMDGMTQTWSQPTPQMPRETPPTRPEPQPAPRTAPPAQPSSAVPSADGTFNMPRLQVSPPARTN